MDSIKMNEEDIDYWKNHMSYSKVHGLKSNDALATLGDAVLDLIVAEYYFEKGYSSGEITIRRSKLVSDKNLAKVAVEIGFDKDLRLSKGAEKAGCRHNQQILEQIMEAYIGFQYIYKGLRETRNLVIDLLINRRYQQKFGE